jgi:hypothetical protein
MGLKPTLTDRLDLSRPGTLLDGHLLLLDKHPADHFAYLVTFQHLDQGKCKRPGGPFI